MDRHRISRIAHREHPIAAPLSDEAVTHVLDGLGGTFLDLGCGGGEWLLRALERSPGARGVGVDVSEPAIAHARAQGERRGLAGRLAFELGDASGHRSPEPVDVVLAVGVTHVFGGLAPTIAAAGEHLAAGGHLVVGEGIWDGTLTPWAAENLGPLLSLAETVEVALAAGWRVVRAHVSSRAELDAYEWAWTGSLTGWALDQEPGPDREQALEVAREHLRGWLRNYRDDFGFVTLVLRRG
ncbi:SAM-dependent methyltransferase [Kineosporia succinea]|uniref:SAM-dependent methyltransferase n=1 Tax=Kineosporia succinea TaxID=84632 RepID=A0ABT9P9X8_9ACTN|nr:class I SAM-dependent methyltransferase [Kineosporia succinea]MDP9829214.1 SAM-dependent methyltransferase [Kineosporia succinea]